MRVAPDDEDKAAAAREDGRCDLEALQTELDMEGRAHPSEVPMSTAAVVALRNVFTAAVMPPD
jgi:hypothetical protein